MNYKYRYFKNSPEVIHLAILLYIKYPLSLRHVEDLVFERGVDICPDPKGSAAQQDNPSLVEQIWAFSRRKGQKRPISYPKNYANWRWHLNEVFVKIGRNLHYLWHAVDHEGDVLKTIVTRKIDKNSALKLLKKRLKRYKSL